jgi:dipeptidyl aminopeptidase/acylaminoacyl peptidase
MEERVVATDSDFFDYHYGRSFGYPLVSPDGKTFLFRSQRSGWTTYWAAPVDGDGEPRQIAPAEADQTDAVWCPDGQWIAYVENHNGTLDLRIVPAAGGEPRVLVAPEQGVCAGLGWSPDGSRISYLFGDLITPNDVWLVNVESGEQRQLTRSMLGGRAQERLVMPEKVTYTTFDGLEINAYLYRPVGEHKEGSCPGIVWVHGGPTSQYMDTYQPQVQFFVGQGYVVIQPNVRGSSGYGRAFEDLNNQDWGGGDLKDVIAAREYLARLPEVDGDHIGITGTSYGGIMTMNAVSFAPGVFQAAVSGSGYCDFVHMHGEQELRHIKLLEFELGKLPEAEEVYRRCSALYRVHQATTPCFVLHGEGQYPNSITSKVFAMALEAHYKTFWYKAYQGEHYYVRTTAGTKRMLQDMLAFFNMYLKGIPHNLPNDGQRPLTHMAGIVAVPATVSARYPGVTVSDAGSPPPDMAN